MKRCVMGMTFLFLMVGSVAAWTPTFTAGIGLDSVSADGLLVGMNDGLSFPSPEFADWDGDGLDDMIVGYWLMSPTVFGDGQVRLFKNVGTKGSPQFESQGDLQAGGSTIKLTAA